MRYVTEREIHLVAPCIGCRVCAERANDHSLPPCQIERFSHDWHLHANNPRTPALIRTPLSRMSAQDRIQEAVSALIGMPLWDAGRTADLAWFAFGERRFVRDSYGHAKEVGDFALHVQCAWRIVQCGKTVVGNRDLRNERPFGTAV